MIVAVVIYFLQKQKKKLSFRILSNTSLLSVEEEIKKDIEISYKGKPVKEVQLIILKFFCLGNISIKTGDYETPITINLGKEAQILSAQILEKKPRDLQTSIRVKDNKVVVQECLLNQEDTITIRILATGIDEDIKVEGRIAGVKKIEEMPEDSRVALTFFACGIVTMLFGWILGAVVTVFMISTEFYFDEILIGVGMGLLLLGLYVEKRIKKRLKKELETLTSKYSLSGESQ